MRSVLISTLAAFHRFCSVSGVSAEWRGRMEADVWDIYLDTLLSHRLTYRNCHICHAQEVEVSNSDIDIQNIEGDTNDTISMSVADH